MKLIRNTITLGLSLIGLSAPLAMATDGLTVEDLAKIQSVVQSQVSPNGDHVAFTRSVPRELYVEKDGKHWRELYLTDDKGVERPFITGQVNIGNIQWAHDGKSLYFTAKMGDDKLTSLYRIPVDGGQAVKVISLKETDISRYRLSPDGKQVALLAKEPKKSTDKELKALGFKAEVYELGMRSQDLFVVDLNIADKPLSPDAWPFEEYVSDVGWSPDGKQLLLKTQPSALIDDKYTQSRWHLVDVATQKITTTFATQGKLGDAEFSHDGRYVAIIGAKDQHDPAEGRLYLAHSQSGKVEPWLADFKGHVSDIEWANNSNTLYFTANVGTQSQVATIKPGQNSYRLAVKPGTFIAGDLSISDSDKTVVVNADTASHPDEVFMLRGRKHQATRLSNSNQWLDSKSFARQETLSLKARDGVDIDGVLIYPLDYQPGRRYPLIMSVHGGPESHDKDGWLTAYSRPGQMGAARGYAVFYPNYRGSTGKGVEYSQLGQNDYAGKEFDDLVDFKNHLVEMGLVDGKKVGITGASYGGYASAWAATKLTKHFAASVMFVGISNQLSKFGTTDISNEMHLVHARSYPWDKWHWYLERSPIYWAHQSETPLLIMHGKDDPRVHPAQSMEMYRYMKVRGKDVRLVYYPGEGHGNKKNAGRYDYSLRLMRWMDNYLMDGNTTMPDYEIDHAAKLKAIKDAKK